MERILTAAADANAEAERSCVRCAWVNTANRLYVDYHDRQWGVPVHDDRLLFEMLILEGAQAGLSWETILKKREAYRRAFDFFDPVIVARYNDDTKAELLGNAGIVRNRRKIESAVQNARVFLSIQEEAGSFDRYLWDWVGGKPVVLAAGTLAEIPVTDAVSDALSADLKRRGMSFVGSTIMYAFMQAVGMINGHTTDCFRFNDLR
ncbi:MAG: DNA-3-methyladenine glycosylase I [Treponema sp.]|nr:MAG: DNA-3-methyladenine glycosylase I [Treponema sp.]